MAWLELLICVLIAAVVYTIVHRKPDDYPPGPWSIPILGNLIMVARSNNFYNLLNKLRNKYGNVFRLVLGQRTVFFIYGHENVTEVLERNSENSMDRPNYLFAPQNIHKTKGIVWANGIQWKKLNELITKAQMNRNIQQNLETLLTEEALDVCQAFNAGSAVDPLDKFQMLTFSMVFILVFGKRYDSSNFKDMYTSALYVLENVQTIKRKETFFNWLAFFTKSEVAKVNEEKMKLYRFIGNMLEEHRKDYDPNRPRDLVDIYLGLPENEKKEDYYSEENIYQSIVDLFLASLETYTSGMLSAVFLLAKYPDIQSKCRLEISENVSGDTVTLNDKEKMPYFDAFIKEFLRLWKPVTLTVYRSNKKALTIGRYTIPSNSIIMLDLMDSQINPKLWENPEEFYPERWLKTNPKTGFIPWGTGPRRCVGSQTGEIALFVLLSNMIKAYEIEAQNSEDLSLEKDHTGVSVRPKPYKISMKPVHI